MARKAQETKSRTTSTSRRRAAATVESETIVGTEPTHDAIALEAYEIHLSGEGGSDVDNWLRAERELRESA